MVHRQYLCVSWCMCDVSLVMCGACLDVITCRGSQEMYESLTKEDVTSVLQDVLQGFEDRLVVCRGLSGKNYTEVEVKMQI